MSRGRPVPSGPGRPARAVGRFAPALDGVDVAYYLVHSLGSPAFEETDRQAAINFAAAARAAGVRRIVYLGGPRRAGSDSAHLRSRDEVGEILSSVGVPTVVLRAAVIIGSGSASFEMLRYLTERLPVMVTPRWVNKPIQPIAVRDVLRYLVAWADVPDEVHRAFDIGGPDVLTYHDMMVRYARIAGLPRRVIVPVRSLTPRLSALWVGLVTPVPGAIARPLVASLVQEAVAHEHDIARYVPNPPEGCSDSTRRSGSRWPRSPSSKWRRAGRRGLDAGTGRPAADRPGLVGRQPLRRPARPDRRAPVDALWTVIEGIGGETGWYSSTWRGRPAGGLTGSSGASVCAAGGATRTSLCR